MRRPAFANLAFGSLAVAWGAPMIFVVPVRSSDQDVQNRYLERHSWDEYGSWHLGLTDDANDETKARYAFVGGRLPTASSQCAHRVSLPSGGVVPQGTRARGARSASVARRRADLTAGQGACRAVDPQQAEAVTGARQARIALAECAEECVKQGTASGTLGNSADIPHVGTRRRCSGYVRLR